MAHVQETQCDKSVPRYAPSLELTVVPFPLQAARADLCVEVACKCVKSRYTAEAVRGQEPHTVRRGLPSPRLHVEGKGLSLVSRVLTAHHAQRRTAQLERGALGRRLLERVPGPAGRAVWGIPGPHRKWREAQRGANCPPGLQAESRCTTRQGVCTLRRL